MRMKRPIPFFLLLAILLAPSVLFVKAAPEQIVFASSHDDSVTAVASFYQTFTLHYKARIVSFTAYLGPRYADQSEGFIARIDETGDTSSTTTVTGEGYYSVSFNAVLETGTYTIKQYGWDGANIIGAYNITFYKDSSGPYQDGEAYLGGDQDASIELYYNDVISVSTNVSSLLQGKSFRVTAEIVHTEPPQSVTAEIIAPNGTVIASSSMVDVGAGPAGEIYEASFSASTAWPEGYYDIRVTSVGSPATAFDDIYTANDVIYVQNAQLETPQIADPTQGSWHSSLTVTLSWSSVPNANLYHIQISNQSDFSSLAVDTTTSDTSITFQAPNNARWYWRVRAEDSTGDWLPSEWNSSDFYVDTLAPIVTLLDPANGSVIASNTMTLQWSSSDNFQIASQTVYWIYPNGTSKTASVDPSLGSYDVVSDDGPLYWWVSATDQAGNSGTSENRTVIVDTRLPDAPTLLAPADESWIAGDTVTLQWENDDPDCRDVLLVVQKEGGGYSFNQTLACSDSYTLQFPAEGHYTWYVRANDWAGNSASSETRDFYVVIGSVVPSNLSGTANGFEFDLKETSGQPQTASWTATAIYQNGLEADSVSGQTAIAASGTAHVSGSWHSTLANGIYKLRVTVTDESGSSKSNETWFLVSTTSSGRDWTQWASDEAVVSQPVNFTRLYFEFGETAEGSHQVQLAINGRPQSCQVWLLDANYTRVKELPCQALTNYVTFTAESRKANESKIYAIYAFMSPLQTTDNITKQKVVYQQVLSDEHNLTIVNQHAYTIYKVKIQVPSNWLGFEGSGWTNESNTLVYGPLEPQQSVSLTYYVPHGAQSNLTAQSSANTTQTSVSLASFIGRYWWLILIVLLAVYYLSRSGRRESGGVRYVH